MEYILHIVIMLNIYILLVLSTNLPVGLANLLSICQAAFYGIGAYFSAYFLIQFHLPFTVVALIVMVLTGLCSLVVSFASVKLKGDYFVLATLAFQMIVFTILYNWTNVTRGPYGIPGIPSVKLLRIWKVTGVYGYFILTTILSLIVILLFKNLKSSPFGRVLTAIRSDELTVSSLGRSPIRFKTYAFFISAAFSGLAGLIYASYISYIDPTSFTIDESIFILTALFIGGIGNIKGPVAGALFVIVLPEILRFVGFPDAVAANLRQIIYGLALVLVMFYRPQGLWGKIVLK
jgi:branched-chain amino acid transport system permease protein